MVIMYKLLVDNTGTYKRFTRQYPMRVFILLLALACSGCGIFDPRSVETPLQTTVAVDPLNFSQLLAPTSIRFSKLSYEDLFNPDFVYFNATDHESDRTTLLNRLTAIYNHSIYDTFSVAWSLDTNYSDPKVFSLSAPVTIYRNYTAFAKPHGGAIIYYSGTSQFVLTYLESNNFWTILQWNDGGVPSLFDPEPQ